ncbi:MAG TPA: hypothetical protein VMV86_05345 [Methanosarcinales archaeon]|nr:hypothetical protein [Methanosarcinales archaeon]
MKKFIVAVLMLVAILAVTNVSYGSGSGSGSGKGGKAGVDVKNTNKNTNLNANLNNNKNENNNNNKNDNKNTNTNLNNNKNDNTNMNDNSNRNANIQGQLQGQIQAQDQNQGQDQSQTSSNVNDLNQGQNQTSSNTNNNEGNQNEINITDNSVYSEIYPTDLLNPTGYVPLADKLDDLYLGKAVFGLQKTVYNYKELTRFANPGRFMGFLWPEWANTYEIEVATFAKYKATHAIQVVPNSIAASALGLTKIGEAQAYAKDLNKSEHQVMAAMAFRATQAGATVVVFKTFSTSLAKVDSFVIGGGGVQGASANSVFNGATGIGSSQSEKKARACVIAELYR